MQSQQDPITVQLTNGNTALLRGLWTRGDRRAVHKAIRVTVHGDDSREVGLDLEDLAVEALLTGRILQWTLLLPTPRQAVNANDIYDQLTDEDGELLAAAVRDQYDHIMKKGQGGKAQVETAKTPTIVSGSVLSTSSSREQEPPAPSTPSTPSTTPSPSTTDGPPTS